jgi:UDP-N-acetylglucosamine 1-carboxyvinyltransferase
MACSNLSQHVTIINAAMEPEIVDLCNFLEKTGVSFKGLGTSNLTIIGTNRKIIKPINYTIIPDRIEAGTFLIACAAAGGDITLEDIRYDHLLSVVKNLKDVGMKISSTDHTIRIISDSFIRPKNLKTDV